MLTSNFIQNLNGIGRQSNALFVTNWQTDTHGYSMLPDQSWTARITENQSMRFLPTLALQIAV